MPLKNLALILTILSFQLLADEVSTQECPDNQRFDSTLNRCVSTATTLKNQSEYNQCDGLKETELSTCLTAAAKTRESETRKDYGDDLSAGDVEKGKTQQLVVNGLFSTLSVIQLVGKGSWNSTCMGTKIFGATSLAGFVKNIAFEKDVKKAVGKMKTEFGQEASEKSTMKDAQLTAFDFLEKEQSYLEKYANEQKKFYNMMALGYVSSVAVAAYEGVTGAGFSKPCNEQKPSEDKADAPKTETTDSLKTQSGDATASETSKIADLKESIANNPILLKLQSLLNTPVGVVIAGGFAAMNSFNLSKKMGTMADEASSNVATITSLKEKYILSISNYCPGGRDDLSKPQCYCYTDKGAKNPNREKSQTCINLWKAPDMLWAESTDATRGSGLASSKGCVYVDGKYDPSCDCKRMTNKSGANACMKVNMPPSAFASIPNLNTATVTTAIDDALSGTDSSASITDANNSQAAFGEKLTDNLIKKLSPVIKSETGKDFSDASNAFLTQARNGLAASGKKVAIYNSPFEGLSQAKASSSNISKAVEEISKSIPQMSASRTSKSKSNNSKANNWDFDSSSDTSVMTFNDVSSDNSELQKKYKYNNNDINTDKDASIWNVISKRYTQSGLRRLFEAKKGLVE